MLCTVTTDKIYFVVIVTSFKVLFLTIEDDANICDSVLYAAFDVDLYTVIRQSIGHIAFSCVLKSSSGFFKFYMLFGYSNCNKILRIARY